ncbi:taurine ABC transporter ATP-binding protein [Erwinia sp. OLTSP20]|uniref:ABC transporter ATP-binding protein n=1 Tax=unclassified Erwinia TaxID=2622719 RepID=UPI000C17F3F3|nr:MULTISPECIES: ABC transporter ATP-binding protein [unclassified Erwinia]PIJ50160.1 taurine ABC transporter ATP-binding protein [Erwinia sp. OAMSP11]PIJ71926.1 taurine ABC transporter ATP-binding protein [Erwinia sp. OLSSP12]PIJ81128.1 taurine ABC transporter ATP-binding protein [Erwinia sp. OLCASP19]PIJ83558.1 taurine ABC transporter ATP-binding protein [Erwinia sp. OLMTSP26]PIJ86173.1 taurine ABC transporter ATP-binding protein [Erwinia sp. OLMDSP33]
MKKRHPLVEMKNVSKSFHKGSKQSIPVLEHINFEVYDNEVVALLGRSGSGKSTLIRMIAGLIEPDFGSIVCNDLPVCGPCRDASMVFQSFALFPWLTVFNNVAFGLQAAKLGREEIERRTMRMLELIGLTDYVNAYPKELSGGMRQRVGFARALAVEPKLMLLDEPFSALDIYTGEKLRQDLIDLWEQRKIATRSMILVTHAVEEAVMLSDRVCLLTGDPATITDTYTIDIPRAERTRENTQSWVNRIRDTLNEKIALTA